MGCRSVIVAALSAWKSVLELVVAELDRLLELGRIAAWQLRGLVPLVLVLLRPMDLELRAAARLMPAEASHLVEVQPESDSAG